ncbi:hypothetical protein BW685_14010 [Burkholderia ubonensis]|uniref:Uncharacterized protein n=1 Tax=Burkholderia ubonensis TaxID=101571 RepID=A0A1R1JC09_9BURK|nr:hypothetical protein BW685_14010 [Burkholderia ubonensis]
MAHRFLASSRESNAHCDAVSAGALAVGRAASNAGGDAKTIIRFCSRRSLHARGLAIGSLRSGHSILPETAMQSCCSRRTVFAGPLSPASLRKEPRNGSRSRAVRSAFAAAGAFALGIVGWRWFESLLNSIPDSNDDFGIG